MRLKSWLAVFTGLLAVDAAFAAVGGGDPQLYRLNLANERMADSLRCRSAR